MLEQHLTDNPVSYLGALLLVLVPLVENVFVGVLVLLQLVLILFRLVDCVIVRHDHLVVLLTYGLVLPKQVAVHQAERITWPLLLVPELFLELVVHLYQPPNLPLQPLPFLTLRVKSPPKAISVLGTFLQTLVEVVFKVPVEEGQKTVTIGELPLVSSRSDALTTRETKAPTGLATASAAQCRGDVRLGPHVSNLLQGSLGGHALHGTFLLHLRAVDVSPPTAFHLLVITGIVH